MDFAQILVTVPAITATVQWAKSTFNISGRWCQLAAVIIGVVFSYAYMVSMYRLGTALTDPAVWVAFGTKGFIYGLAAAGFYDLANGNLKGTGDAQTFTPRGSTSGSSVSADDAGFLPADGLLDPNQGTGARTNARAGKHEAL